jgi:DNA replicative helicase MCM subunit Mcm2 (Cdc46/Mcm family)
VFVVKDSTNESELREYVNKKTQLLMKKIPDYYTFLKKYLSYAKQFNPILTEDARILINEYYVNLVKHLNPI